jgi:hypothetical protein
MTRKSQRRNKLQGADLEAQPDDELEGVHYNFIFYSSLTPLYKEARRKSAHEMRTLRSGHKDEASEATGSNVLVREAQASSSTQSQALPPTDGPSISGEHITIPTVLVALGPHMLKNAGGNVQSGDARTPDDTAQPIPSEMHPMIGDFDDNANAMWSLHLTEAKSHDEAQIHSLKDDMDGVLLFVRVNISIVVFLAISCTVF